jgi:tRNA(Ile)-lysidine synthase
VKKNPDPGGAFLRKLQLDGLSRTARLLVAVSGGRDSSVLLHALSAAGFKKLVVCHLNHHLRGRASAADARFVRAQAEKLGLECEIGEADVNALAASEGRSIETAAREARYRFFASVAKARRCRTVVLAHHADDQVETFLFNLFRGSGRSGLGGMSPESTRTVAGVALRLVRPMLGIWRKEIDQYAAEHKIRHREDASNQSLVYTRNRVRHELLPKLEPIFGRDVRTALLRNAEIMRAEEEWLATLVPEQKEETLSVPELISQPVALQRRRILAWLRSNGVPDVGFSGVETVRSLLEGGRAKVNLPGNRHARRRAKRLFLE